MTEKQTRTSRLLISRALPADSGNYTCAPSTAESASVLVHVLNGGWVTNEIVHHRKSSILSPKCRNTSPYIFFAIISAKLLVFREVAFLDAFDADISNKISNTCKYVSAKNALHTVKIAREIHSNTKRYLPVSTCRYKKALHCSFTAWIFDKLHLFQKQTIWMYKCGKLGRFSLYHNSFISSR